jgi:hypothetical protein
MAPVKQEEKQQKKRPVELLYEALQQRLRRDTPNATTPASSATEWVSVDVTPTAEERLLGVIRDARSKGIVSDNLEESQQTVQERVSGPGQ